MEFLNFFLAFLEGCALILSPCILPILPIILSGTIAGDKRRPLGIITGFAVTFALFTLGSRFLVAHVGISFDWLRDAAFLLIALFGLVMVSDALSEKFGLITQKIANTSIRLTSGKPGGFLSGLLLGSLVSLIWTPCAGPILAAALVQIATQKTVLGSVIALFAFALGSVTPMLLIALVSKKMLYSINIIKKHTIMLRKIFGLIIIITALLLAYITHFRPDLWVSLATPTEKNPTNFSVGLTDKLIFPYAAPSLAGSGPWINSSPLTLASLKDKVVLIDFWTYSCINCLRTLPYLLVWDKAYRNHGLVIIGVHTPEFEFEKNVNNVQQAVKRLGITYPVFLDNQYATWRNYNNSYWPAHYLIDKQGAVVYQHFGEGDYAATEHNIRVLLGLNLTEKKAPDLHKKFSLANNQTPETYFGYERSQNFASSQEQVPARAANYTFPLQLAPNYWALNGTWQINGEKIIAKSSAAAIKIHFNAQAVYVVMGNTAATPVTAKVLLNGQLIGSQGGKDVRNSEVIVTGQRLYEIGQFSTVKDGEITLLFLTPGVELYTFTFG